MTDLIERAAKGGWMPIETAPKDRKILLWMSGSVRIGKYDEDKYAKKPRPYWDCEASSWLGKTWARLNQPTHWQPIPEPPEAAE